MLDRLRAALDAFLLPHPGIQQATEPAGLPARSDVAGAIPDLIEIRVNGLDAAKQHAVWLTKGTDRTQRTSCVRLSDCTSDHLKAIVANKPGLSADYRRVIESILEDRGDTLPPAAQPDPVPFAPFLHDGGPDALP